MKSKALCARAVSAAAAVVMCLSAAPAMYLGSGYVYAAEGQSAQSISNGLPVVYITIDETAEGFGEGAYYYQNVDRCIDRIERHLHPDDTILVKASHSMQFERIVEALS